MVIKNYDRTISVDLYLDTRPGTVIRDYTDLDGRPGKHYLIETFPIPKDLGGSPFYVKHRLDGPAVERENGNEWFYYGQKIDCSSQEEYERILRLKAFW